MALARALVPFDVQSETETDRLVNTRKLAQNLGSGELTLRDVFAACRSQNKGRLILLIADQLEEAFTLATIRSHWHVENKLHYIRDVTFQEDQSRIRHNPGVFARIRSFGYKILRRNQTRTFNPDRYAAALAWRDAIAKWCIS